MTNDTWLLREALRVTKRERDAIKTKLTLLRTAAAILFAIAVAAVAIMAQS